MSIATRDQAEPIRGECVRDARVLGSLMAAIAVGALPEFDHESPLVELGAAAMLLLEAWEGSASQYAHELPLSHRQSELGRAVALLRECVVATFGEGAVRHG